jgi:hypothetical protein
MNMLILTVGGMTLGGIIGAIVRDAVRRELHWWERGLHLIAGCAIIYGVTQVPYLGG